MAERKPTNAQERMWLTLSQVAELLGVHPSTVRLWADQGKLPVYRTPGGHRRFLRDEILAWIRTHRPDETSWEELLPMLLRRIRFRLGEEALFREPWYQKLSSLEARETYKRMGRQTLQVLLGYLDPERRSEASSQIDTLAQEYATLARRYRLSLEEAARALLFFRALVLESLMDALDDLAVNSAQIWRTVWQASLQFTDQVLLSLIRHYQGFREPAPATNGQR